MSEVATLRAQVDEAVKGKNFGHVLERNVRERGDKPAMSWRHDDQWHHYTWREVRERVAEVAMGLKALGLNKGDAVAIQARNIPDHVIADQGILHAGGVPVSFYNTFSPDQIQYIAGHCEARFAILEGKAFLERWEKIRSELPKLEKVVLINGAEEYANEDWIMSYDDLLARGREALKDGRDDFEGTWREVSPDDPATLIYTSGTTGNPKGVVTTNYNAIWTAHSSQMMENYTPGSTYVSYLPLAHSAERVATIYVSFYTQTQVYYCPEVLQVFEIVPQVHPYSFLAVPRVWEKLQAGIMAKVSAEPDAKKRKIASGALATGTEVARRMREGEPVPLGMKIKNALFEKLVFSKIRGQIGLDKCELPLSGAAPISPSTLDFFDGIGVHIIELYGLTETSAPALGNTAKERKSGTVGKPLPGVEIRLLEDGELLVRGGNVTLSGYYREPEKTAEAFDAEGWLHTGDIAEIDADGFVKIVDRKKELIITAGGKNVAPSNIESMLKVHPLISQVCAIGDRRRFISALIVLDPEASMAWAKANGVPFESLESFAANERVHAEIQKAVDEGNSHLNGVEQVKKFRILQTEWTPESEELTPSLKLKRRVILEKYDDDIEAMYA
ncbi:MAG: long-chain fatty acid--CoA ligase [Actinobacteria bacterium]|nr:long-chain fatty acid--CoA ligase [Actinomycetota bacterium]